MSILECIMNTDVSVSIRHNHPCLEIVHRVSGITDTTVGDQTFHVTPGDLYLVPAYAYHSDIHEGVFTDFFIRTDLYDFPEPRLLRDSGGSTLALMEMILKVLTEQEYNYQNIANSLMEALHQYLVKLSASASDYPASFVLQLKNAMYTNIDNPDFNLTQEIQNTGFHPDYVRRCFKTETGRTPLEYLTTLRINKAIQLLTQCSHKSIETIASNCGFRDSFYFSTCFKKYTGLSPLQYRKQHPPDL